MQWMDFEPVESGRDVADHRFESLRGQPGRPEPLGKSHYADGQRVVADQSRAAIRVDPHPGEFGRAAADIEQQGAARGAHQQRSAAFQRQLNFFP